jgi:DHA2 family multidrug resistance protein
VGPTLGGWLSDNLSWHWCFLINMPVGIICSIAIYFVLPSSPEKKRARQELWAKGPDFDLVASFWSRLFSVRWKSCWTGDRLTIGSDQTSS